MQLLKYILVSFSISIGSVQAGIIDFTSNDWNVGQGVQKEFTFGDIKLSSNGYLTFNDPDGASGCGKGNATQTNLATLTGLACIGDGIGIGDDEITQGGSETLTLTFLNGAVDILDIHLLDLFTQEQSGEIAIINEIESHALTGGITITNNGGYWETGLGFLGVNSLTFTAMTDSFSDYSLARVLYEPVSVPEPSITFLLASGLLGLGLVRRRRQI